MNVKDEGTVRSGLIDDKWTNEIMTKTVRRKDGRSAREKGSIYL